MVSYICAYLYNWMGRSCYIMNSYVANQLGTITIISFEFRPLLFDIAHCYLMLLNSCSATLSLLAWRYSSGSPIFLSVILSDAMPLAYCRCIWFHGLLQELAALRISHDCINVMFLRFHPLLPFHGDTIDAWSSRAGMLHCSCGVHLQPSSSARSV